MTHQSSETPLSIRPLDPKDFGKVVDFAITGMHFDWYLKNGFLRKVYGRYFLYLELCKSSQVIAAYDGDSLAGVLMANMEGKPNPYATPFRKAFIRVVERIQDRFFSDSVGVYDAANREMLEAYLADNRPDGELDFLAADPDSKGRGTGTVLLNELARQEPGKEIYLYTDNACTYQFYEHRGFDRVGERDIVLDLGPDRKVPLTCLLYRKKL